MLKSILSWARPPSPEPVSPPAATPPIPNHFRRIWDLVSLSQPDFDGLYIATTTNIVHSPYFSNLNDTQRTEIFNHAVNAMKVRRGFILPANTPPEHLWKEQEMWTFAVFYSAMLSKYLQLFNTSEPLGDPLTYLSPTATKWLNERVKVAIKSNIYCSVSPLDPVFQKLYSIENNSKPLIKTESDSVKETAIAPEDSKHCNIRSDLDNAQLELDHDALFHASVERMKSQNALSLLPLDGGLIISQEHLEVLDEIYTKRSGSSYSESDLWEVTPVAYYLEGDKTEHSGYAISQEHEDCKKTLRVFLAKSLESALQLRLKPLPDNSFTPITIVRELLRDLALSPFEFALGSPLSVFNVCKEGLCIDKPAWSLIVSHIESRVALSGSMQADAKWIGKLHHLTDKPYVTAPKLKLSELATCVFFMDNYYSEKNYRESHFALTPPTPVSFSHLVPFLNSYAAKAAKLGTNPPKAARTRTGLFLPNLSAKYFFADYLGFYGDAKDILPYISDCADSGNVRATSCILGEKAISGILFQTKHVRAPGELLSLNEAIALEDMDYALARTLFHDAFGTEQCTIRRSSFKTFAFKTLKSSATLQKLSMELALRSGIMLDYSNTSKSYTYKNDTEWYG